MTERVERFTPGEWEWWTSCSWKRLKSQSPYGTHSVAEPYVCSDGHPDLSISEEDMALVCQAPNMYSFIKSMPCPQCDGSGVVEVESTGTEAGCCGSPHPNGECCGNAVPVPVQMLEQEQCQFCAERDALLAAARGEQ